MRNEHTDDYKVTLSLRWTNFENQDVYLYERQNKFHSSFYRLCDVIFSK